MKLTFAVITWVNPKQCCYDDIILLQGNSWYLIDTSAWPDNWRERHFKGIKVQVFERGEILILNEHGREIAYPGRKPAKWGVNEDDISQQLTKTDVKTLPMLYQTFCTLKKAIECAEKVDKNKYRPVCLPEEQKPEPSEGG